MTGIMRKMMILSLMLYGRTEPIGKAATWLAGWLEPPYFGIEGD